MTKIEEIAEAGFSRAFSADMYCRDDGVLVVETTVGKDVWRAMIDAALAESDKP